MTIERWFVLWSLACLVPMTIHVYRRRHESQWAQTSMWVGLALIILMLCLLLVDPEPRGGRMGHNTPNPPHDLRTA